MDPALVDISPHRNPSRRVSHEFAVSHAAADRPACRLKCGRLESTSCPGKTSFSGEGSQVDTDQGCPSRATMRVIPDALSEIDPAECAGRAVR